MTAPKHFEQLKAGDRNHALTKEASGQLRRRAVADHGGVAAALCPARPRLPLATHGPSAHAASSFLPLVFLSWRRRLLQTEDRGRFGSGRGSAQTLGQGGRRAGREHAPSSTRRGNNFFSGKDPPHEETHITRLERRQRSRPQEGGRGHGTPPPSPPSPPPTPRRCGVDGEGAVDAPGSRRRRLMRSHDGRNTSAWPPRRRRGSRSRHPRVRRSPAPEPSGGAARAGGRTVFYDCFIAARTLNMDPPSEQTFEGAVRSAMSPVGTSGSSRSHPKRHACWLEPLSPDPRP